MAKWHEISEIPETDEVLVVQTESGYEAAYWTGNTFFNASACTTKAIIRDARRWAELER